MPAIHSELPNIEALIKEEFLFDLKEGKGKYRNARLIAVSSYPGHVPTFTALVEDKYLFHYLPIHAFVTKVNNTEMTLADASPFNCPSEKLVVFQFSGLKTCQVFAKDRARVIGLGNYLMTFDWYQDNELCHLVELVSGQLILAPSHKIVFNNPVGALPAFKKLHSEWRV